MDMRLIATIIMGITLLPQIHAIGIGTFDDYSGGFSMDQGDEIDLDFVLRGDDVENNDVEFFISSIPIGSIQFNGDEEYRISYDLEEYEDKEISVEMKAMQGGDEIKVIYGYYLQPEESGFGVATVVDNSFTVDVDADEATIDEDDFDILVDGTEEESSGPRGRSGGGGGAYIPPEEDNRTYVNGLWQDPETGIYYDAQGDEYDPEYAQLILDGKYDIAGNALTQDTEVIAQDVGGSESATNEIVATGGTPSTPSLSSTNIDEGKGMMLLVLVIGFLAVVSTFGAAAYMNREGSE